MTARSSCAAARSSPPPACCRSRTLRSAHTGTGCANAAPREIVAAFDGRVPVERPDVPVGFVLRGQLGDVGVTLRGPEGVADRMALAVLPATLDLAGVDASRPEPHDAKVLVTVSNGAVKVVDVTPATVSVR